MPPRRLRCVVGFSSVVSMVAPLEKARRPCERAGRGGLIWRALAIARDGFGLGVGEPLTQSLAVLLLVALPLGFALLRLELLRSLCRLLAAEDGDPCFFESPSQPMEAFPDAL